MFPDQKREERVVSTEAVLKDVKVCMFDQYARSLTCRGA